MSGSSYDFLVHAMKAYGHINIHFKLDVSQFGHYSSGTEDPIINEQKAG
jgi:alpha-D-ribose 1-methylphosphonate 5-phosphate C-P lyase